MNIETILNFLSSTGNILFTKLKQYFSQTNLSPVFENPPAIDINVIADLMANKLIPWANYFIVLTAFFMIVVGGYKYYTTSGSADKMKEAAGSIQWAIIGLIFVFSVRLIMGLIVGIIRP